MVRDGGLRAADRLDEVAGAHLTGLGRGQEGQDAEPGGIGQRGEAAGQLGGVGFAQRRRTDRRATRSICGVLQHGDHPLLAHVSHSIY